MDKQYPKKIILPPEHLSFFREEKPILKCSVCSEPVYKNELVHYIGGKVICPDCFFDFAFDYFSADLIPASQIGRDYI